MKFTLEEWRRLKNISQQHMANELNVNINTYRAWEKEPSKIKLATASKIVEILGVSMDDIIFLP